MKNFKKKTAAFMGVVTALCLTIGTLAVFTDRFQAQTTATAGTLDITLTQSWTADNAAIADVYKPGTALQLNYTLGNKGNMPADVREQFVITYDKALSDGTKREFDLYKAGDITVDGEGNVTAISGTALTPTYDTDKKVLTYKLTQHTMAGTSDASAPTTYDDGYYLVFNQNVDNSFQEVNVKIEYLAQALQDNNTGDNTWENALVITENFTIGGQSIKVVPQLNEN